MRIKDIMMFGILLFSVTFPYNAQDIIESNDGFFYVKDNVLEQYIGFEECVVIPTDIGITEIRGLNFLSDLSNDIIKSVIIPESVTVIGNQTFAELISITNINIPENVTAIGAMAFFNCKSLTSITIPANVAFIGKDAFRGCTSLTSINVDERNTSYISIDGVLYNKNKTLLIKYPASKNEQIYTIPSSVTAVESRAFSGNRHLQSITIPANTSFIGMDAFDLRFSLTSINVDKRNTSYTRTVRKLANRSKSPRWGMIPARSALKFRLGLRRCSVFYGRMHKNGINFLCGGIRAALERTGKNNGANLPDCQ
ncbi:MAG: leucine-rich repeat domain-containing protein [Treponema sp.]|nr:leucine-rich repeat domain-containing protein [Treponema sp.]